MHKLQRDTGAALRAEYGHIGGANRVFGNKARDYDAARPGYPAALFDAISDRLEARRSKPTVVDIGAGTGLFTAGLLGRGWSVHAIEPADEMRAAADARHGRDPDYRSAAGSAEAIPLGDSSVDLITAAQAFHWFEVDTTRREALRVLRQDGEVALIWNDRIADAAINVALDEEVFRAFGGSKRAALSAHIDRQRTGAFFGEATSVERLTFDHVQLLDAAGLEALAFSRSYMPPREDVDGLAAARRVRAIHARHANAAGFVTLPYAAIAFTARPAQAGG